MRKYEIGYEYYYFGDTQKRQLRMETLYVTAPCLEEAIQKGYKLVREQIKNLYLVTFAVEEVWNYGK